MAWNRINAYPIRVNLINVVKLAVFIIIWSIKSSVHHVHCVWINKIEEDEEENGEGEKKKRQCYQWQAIKNAMQSHLNVTQSLVCCVLSAVV